MIGFYLSFKEGKDMVLSLPSSETQHAARKNHRQANQNNRDHIQNHSQQTAKEFRARGQR